MDRDEFERLVRRHHAAVFRSAQRVLRDDGRAMDVAQEVFLELLRDPARFRAAEDPERVLRWMAAKKALHESRGARNRHRRESERAMHESSRSKQTDRDPIESNELRELLARCIEALPRELRTALSLRFDEAMTYAAIAEATACSEPTAHDRVQRALAALRERLGRAGYATSAPALAAWIEESGRASVTAPVPAGLEARLLGLATSANAVALPSVVPIASGVALLACAAVAVVLALGARSKAERGRATPIEPVPTGIASSASLQAPPEFVLASSASERRAALGTARPLAPAQDEDAATSALPKGAFTGRVLDLDRRPVAGAEVVAASVARSGKLARFVSEALTGDDGRFRVEASVEEAQGQRYSLSIRHPELVLRYLEPAALRAGETVDLGELLCARNSDDQPGSFALVAHLVDEGGAPIERALATLSRRVRGPDGAWKLEREASGLTDAAGRIELAGEHLGAKELAVDARSQGFRDARFELAVERPGPIERTFELARGSAISGRIVTTEGDAPQGLQVRTTGEDANPWLFADVAPDGRFELRGLDEGSHAIAVSATSRSAALVTAEAGERDLRIVLKRADDERDLGDHMAEIHGRVLDAASGEPVAVDFWAVDLDALDETERALSLAQLVARHLFPPIAQRAEFGPLPEPSDRFHRGGLPPGAYLVVVRVRGYAPAFAGPIELDAHGMQTQLELRLARGATLAGRIVDAKGAPLADGYVWLGDPGTARARLAELDAALVRQEPIEYYGLLRADADGRFRREHLPPGIALATGALHPAAAPALGPLVVLEAGEERADLELRLAPR